MFDVKATDTKLHNTFNEFLMLSNSQFIENRVYEEDETAVEDKLSKDVGTYFCSCFLLNV